MKPRPATGDLDEEFRCIHRGTVDSLCSFQVACLQPVWACSESLPAQAVPISGLLVQPAYGPRQSPIKRRAAEDNPAALRKPEDISCSL